MRELHKATSFDDLVPLQNALKTATDILITHALTVPPDEIGLTLPPRTIPLQTAINTSFDLLTSLIDTTITNAFNNITTSTTKKKLTHSDLQAKISELYLENVKNLDVLLSPHQGNPQKQRRRFKAKFNTFFTKHKHLEKLFTEQKERCETLIDDYTSTAADIEQYQADKKSQQKQSHSQEDPTTPPQPQAPESQSRRPTSTSKQDTRNKITPGLKTGNHKPRRETVRTLKQAFKKITAHLSSIQRQLQHMQPLLTDIATAKTAADRKRLIAQQLHPRYLQLRSRLNSTLSVHNTTHINYNTSFGPPKGSRQIPSSKGGSANSSQHAHPAITGTPQTTQTHPSSGSTRASHSHKGNSTTTNGSPPWQSTSLRRHHRRRCRSLWHCGRPRSTIH